MKIKHAVRFSPTRSIVRAALVLGVVLASILSAAPLMAQQEKAPAVKKIEPDPEYVRKMIPIKISGTYEGGELVELRLHDRMAYLVKPTGKVDPQKRWIWIFPFWLGINDGYGRLHHRMYVEKYLAEGFHVAGINVGTSCGSPAAAKVCHEFYEQLVRDHKLNARVRLLGQSNGGLMAYAWAFRHPGCVARIAGICPATDFRTWPGLANVIAFPEKGLDYEMSLEALAGRVAELNPVDNLAPLAKSGVKILHIHGDKDDLVPMQENSTELARRYRELGGSAEIVVIKGLAHGGKELYESDPLLAFLIAPGGSDGRREEVSSGKSPRRLLEKYFEPPEEFAGQFGSYRSPLKFADGTPARSAEDWRRRRKEILDTWHRRLGPWPSLVERPALERLESVERDGYTEHHVHVQVSLDGKQADGFLLIPNGAGPFPAVLVPFYEPFTSIGRGENGRGTHDYGSQLARRGYVTLSIGTPGSLEKIGLDTRQLLVQAGAQQRRQPLTLLAYVAANCHTALAQMPEVDPMRIGIIGLSYGGKWSMFASCLYEKFACAV
ncbi:MAG TPA: prolyl oligopeptidase family serine peptidase, partial [Planctomycetaceae bacterium]|nr:prolyl oligopeptidase family serine peptidase [Planctomycetaceae bacterium]